MAEISGITRPRRARESVSADAGADGRLRALGDQRLRGRRSRGRRAHRARRTATSTCTARWTTRCAMVERHRATVLWGVPSFVRRVIMRAGRARRRLPQRAHVRDYRRGELARHARGHAPAPARARVRAAPHLRPLRLDRARRPRPVPRGGRLAQSRARRSSTTRWSIRRPGRRLPDGERGALAITHLDRRGTVLVRYLVGDIVSLAHGPVPALRPQWRPRGRTDRAHQGPAEGQRHAHQPRASCWRRCAAVPGVDEFQVVLRAAGPRRSVLDGRDDRARRLQRALTATAWRAWW